MGDIPDAELATILQQRCALAPSYSAKLVAVMRELQRRRQVRFTLLLHCLTSCQTTVLVRPRLAAALPLQSLLHTNPEHPICVSWECLSVQAHDSPHLLGMFSDEKNGLQATNVFAGKHGYITPRDLFKWAGRGAVGYQQLSESGYLLLAERLRSAPERAVVQEVLESVMRVKVSSHALALEFRFVCRA